MSVAQPQTQGELMVALSNQIVGIYKELYGKGPVKARTWLLDDVVVCVLRGGLTRSEETLVGLGRGERVVLQRDDFHDATEPVFAVVVEELTGRVVETVLPATDETRDVMTLVFLLQSSDGAAVDRTGEGLMRQAKQSVRHSVASSSRAA